MFYTLTHSVLTMTYEVGTVISPPFLLIRKLKHRGVKVLARNLTFKKCTNPDNTENINLTVLGKA